MLAKKKNLLYRKPLFCNLRRYNIKALEKSLAFERKVTYDRTNCLVQQQFVLKREGIITVNTRLFAAIDCCLYEHWQQVIPTIYKRGRAGLRISSYREILHSCSFNVSAIISNGDFRVILVILNSY